MWLGGTPVARIKDGQVHLIHTDHLGRPEIVTNSAKAVVWRAGNYAFDRTVTQDSIGGLNLGFPGQYHDAETGLAYNYFRTYNPRTGRYLESDPIGLVGGMNTYAYVTGNPVSSVDPLGLGPWLALACGIGDILYTGYQAYNAVDISALEELREAVRDVEQQMDNCPMDDDRRYLQLMEKREELTKSYLNATKDHIAQLGPLTFTMQNATEGAIIGAVCLALIFAPTP